MPQNQKPSPGRYRGQARSPQSFDIAPTKPKKAAPFPAVGMTLNTYQKQPDSPNRQAYASAGRSRWQRFRSIFTKKRVILGIILIIVLNVGWIGFKFVYNAHRLFGGSVLSGLTASPLTGESSGRVNILLAGNSADDPGHQGANLTDSIIILSIGVKDHSAFMLSVPRDLYVAIPDGGGHQKINAVYPYGQAIKFAEDGYASGGMGLLEKVISENLGVHCQYYALVNYDALRDAVNDVGGIDLNIQSSDPRGLYDPSKDYATHGILVKLTNGQHHLDGEQALDLARARGDAYGSYGFANSDFDRTAHQRQIILALRAKATTAGVLANPLKLGKLFDAVGANVTTDLSLGNVHRLYDLTKNISGNGIQSLSLNSANGVNLLANYRTSSGESALVPAAGPTDYSAIQQYIQQITSTDPVVREAATVMMLNGTATSGLAAHWSYVLNQKNINVSAVADADNSNYTQTKIIDLTNGAKPATKQALLQALPGSAIATTNPFGSQYKADFIVVLGTDRISSKTAN